MTVFEAYFMQIESPQNRAKLTEIMEWILKNCPTLEPRLAGTHHSVSYHG